MMPSDIGWLVPGRILYCRSWDTLSITCVQDEATFILRQISDVGLAPGVHLFFDSLDLIDLNVPVSLLNMQTRRFLRHPLVRWNIDITRNPKNRVLGHVISDLANVRWHTVDNRADALSFLHSQDDSLPELNESLFDTLSAKRFD